jgi:hypothetical protein
MPMDMGDLDRTLKDMYGPAMIQQLKDGETLMAKLGWTPVEISRVSRFRYFLGVLLGRLNGCYMHIRYGACDEKKEWYDHVC